MANNRMWMTCEECGKQILLAKYYPSTDWRMWDRSLDHSGTQKRFYELDDFFEEHRHEDHDSDVGPTHFKIEYEITKEESDRIDRKIDGS